MKLQDFLIPASLAFCTMLMINYFFPSKQALIDSEIRSGQTFLATSSAQMCQPLKTEIDFFDKQSLDAPVETLIKTYGSKIQFSSAGGVIDNSVFYKHLQGNEDVLASISYVTALERETGAFLIALDENTPYYFTVLNHVDHADFISLLYEAKTDQVRMIKEYRIFKTNYKIDLILTIEPLVNDVLIQPRIFLPVPYIPESDAGKMLGLTYSTRGVLEEVKVVDHTKTVWASPAIFGTQGRYFMNALINDNNNFVKRAYFKQSKKDTFTAILEGPAIQEKTSWELSFYCGPKESASLAAVDKRLEGAMGYGWFAPIAKLMMYLLNWAYQYVHNYGWAIILLTIVMRLLMFPFTRGGEGDMHKKKQNYERKLMSLKHRYKDDPQALAREQVKLFKEESPFSGSGCLMMLVQMPVFSGLNYALRNSIELYKAPFLWISDLSAPDAYYLLPTLMGLSMFFTLSDKAKDPRQKVATFIGVLFIAGLLAKLSAGLALYLVVSVSLGFALTKFDKIIKA